MQSLQQLALIDREPGAYSFLDSFDRPYVAPRPWAPPAPPTWPSESEWLAPLQNLATIDEVEPNVRSRRRHRKRVLAVAYLIATLAVSAAWMVTVRPIALGGPATYVLIRGVSMEPTYHGGDLVIARRQAAYHAGDIVAYKVPKGQMGAGITVIHRIVGGDGVKGYVIKGDNNPDNDTWEPKDADVLGKAWVVVPRVGELLAFLHAPVPLAGLATGIVVAMMLVPDRKKGKAKAKQNTRAPVRESARRT